MKTLNAKGFTKTGAQAGFTIIELVVVILLLGILTATALPRFLDVTDEAHLAVVDGTQSGLATGAALFRAQWIATGQPITAITEFGGNFAHTTSGYPIGDTATGTALTDATDCQAVAVGLLQQLGTVVFTVNGTITAVASGVGTGVATAATATTDFVSTMQTTSICEYYYVGQNSANGDTTSSISLDVTNGTIVVNAAANIAT